MFDEADKNHNGKLDKKEFLAALEKEQGLAQLMDGPPNIPDDEDEVKQQVDFVFRHADKNHDGKLSWKEITGFIFANCKKNGGCPSDTELNEFHQMFKAADTNHDHKVSKAEVMAAIKAHS